MDYLSSAIFTIGLLGEASMFVLLIILGKRLGQALELPSYYRLYWVAVLLLLLPLPLCWALFVAKAWGLPEPGAESVFPLKVMVALLPTAIAVTFALFSTARYWSWIWEELRRAGKGGGDSNEA